MRERVTLWRLIIGCTHKMHFLINMGGDVTQSCDKIFVPSERGYYSDRSASFQALNAQSVSVCHSHVSRRTVRNLEDGSSCRNFWSTNINIYIYIYISALHISFLGVRRVWRRNKIFII